MTAVHAQDRLVDVLLDPASIGRGTPDQEHERRVAASDLIESGVFGLPGKDGGPYRLEVGLRDAKLTFGVRTADDRPVVTHYLSMSPFRTLLRDYRILCENHHQAARTASPDQIEALDAGRRSLHNEAAELLASRLKGKITADFETMRRLFTLITALHWRG